MARVPIFDTGSRLGDGRALREGAIFMLKLLPFPKTGILRNSMSSSFHHTSVLSPLSTTICLRSEKMNCSASDFFSISSGPMMSLKSRDTSLTVSFPSFRVPAAEAVQRIGISIHKIKIALFQQGFYPDEQVFVSGMGNIPHVAAEIATQLLFQNLVPHHV